jgi:hypothetical protein
MNAISLLMELIHVDGLMEAAAKAVGYTRSRMSECSIIRDI